MKEDRELKFIFLYLNFILVVLGLIIYAVLTNNKLDRINERLDALEVEAATTEAVTTEEVTTEMTTEATTEKITTQATTETTTEVTTEQTTEATEPPTEDFTEEVEEIPIEETEAVIESPESSESGNYLGWYELTAYEWTGSPCANGNYPTAGYTVACNDLALGTRIYIEGYGEYVVEDTGGMGSGVIDIYLGDPESCIQFGRQGANVYLVGE